MLCARHIWQCDHRIIPLTRFAAFIRQETNVMSNIKKIEKYSAARLTSSIFGILGGLGGIVHGIGEVLQGNAKPDGIFIRSWATGPIAMYLDGDPGITIIPDFLLTGILALTICTAIILWSIVYLKSKRGGLILILLSLASLFVGAGVGPPILGILAGIAGLGIGASYMRLRAFFHEDLVRRIAKFWPWIFGIAVANGIFLVLGHVIAVYFFAPVHASVFQNSFYLAIALMVPTILTGIFYDISGMKIKIRSK